MEIRRNKRPKTGVETKFSLPKFKKYFLKNGSEIYTVKKTDLPIIKITFIINSGSKFDPKNKNGVSNLTGMCIDEGSGKYNALQLADEFDFLGAQFSIQSDSDITVLSLQVLTENFDAAFELLSFVILLPHFNENDFQRERRKVQTRIEQLKDAPDYIANSAFEYFLFGKAHPYAFPVIGISESIKEIEISNLKNFYKGFFKSRNTSIVAVGNFDDNKLLKKVENVFENWDNGEKISTQNLNGNKNKQKIYVVNKQDSVQTEIRLGHNSSKRDELDYFQKHILNLILGGQFSSRLNLNLREKHGYTYGIRSQFNYYKDDAYFSVSTSVSTENTAAAVNEILTELNKIRDGITDEELTFAKSSISRRFPLNFETYSQIASNIASKIIHNLPDDYFQKYLTNILNIKIEEVNSAAFKSIIPESALVVLCGDEKKINEQLSSLNLGDVVSVDYEQIYSE
ncbi:MAG: insulinase family protein [Ignavibacteria bacterium]|nr:insulinase family protein [Ignavibacteria bacterium]